MNKEKFENVFAAAAEKSCVAELARKNQFAENLEVMMCELRDKLNSLPAEQLCWNDMTEEEKSDFFFDLSHQKQIEQPSEDLEEAFDGVLPNPNWYISNDGEDAYNVKQMEEMFCAGAQWQKDKLLNKACKWLNKNVVEYHPRKGELRPVVNINAFREAMEMEDEQS